MSSATRGGRGETPALPDSAESPTSCTGCGGPLGDEVWLPVDQLVTDESVFCTSACALTRQQELTR